MHISLVSQERLMNSDKMSSTLNTIKSEYIDNIDLSLNDEHIKENKFACMVNKEDNHINEKKIQNGINKLNKVLKGSNTHLEYERHEVFKNQLVVKIIDDDTKKVIKEIPPKKILDMVAEMCKLAGVIVDKKA